MGGWGEPLKGGPGPLFSMEEIIEVRHSEKI